MNQPFFFWTRIASLGMAALFAVGSAILLWQGLLTGMLGALCLMLAWLLAALLGENFSLRTALRQERQNNLSGKKNS